MFPFDEYKEAVVSESEARKMRAEAEILNFERDPENGENYLLAVKFLQRCDASQFEDGIVQQDGVDAFRGEIVEMDVALGTLTVKAVGSGHPDAALLLYLYPADYLENLRRFAVEIAERREDEKESRFESLRDALLSEDRGGLTVCDSSPFLRRAQSAAVEMAKSKRLSFVWGPPGTGKSYTLGHIAECFRSRGERVLLISNTNAAVDVATFAIDDACRRTERPLSAGQLIRYTRVLAKPEGYKERPHLLEYTRLLQRYAAKERDLAKQVREAKDAREQCAPGSQDFNRLTFAIMSAMAELKELGSRRREEVDVLLAQAQIVSATLTSAMYNGFVSSSSFDVVLVDEASVMPLAVWPFLLHRTGQTVPRFVIAGDPMQLPPIFSGEPDSLNEKWFAHNIYSHLGMNDWRGIKPFVESGAVTLLNEQTRMRREICVAVSARFYGGMLTGDRTDETRPWTDASGIPQAQIVLLNPGVGRRYVTRPKWGRPGGDVRNTDLTSAEMVEGIVRKMIAEAPVLGDPLEILVVTPFANQCRYVYERRMKALEHLGNVRIAVSTVHRSQGAEADIVFFDTVDAGAWFLRKPDAARLWCVACSRARRQLFVLAEEYALRDGTHSGPLFAKIDYSKLS